MLEEVLAAARQVSDDDFIHEKVMDKALQWLVDEKSQYNNPAELLYGCLKVASKALGVKDPFLKEKARLNQSMQGLEKRLKQFEQNAPDTIISALRFSLAASTDSRKSLGREDLDALMRKNLAAAPQINDSTELDNLVAKADKIMLILNSAGEIVVDKLLADQIVQLGAKKHITVVVAAKPVLTRAMQEDAITAGFSEFAEIVDPGAGMVGLSIDKASAEFREKFCEADLVIAKGDENFETLKECGREVAFILQCNCPYTAARFKVAPGSGVIAIRDCTRTD